MAIPAEVYDICVAAGRDMRYTTPLLDVSHSDKCCTCVYVSGKCCFLRHYDDGLQRAEAVQVSSMEDTLYYIIKMRNEASVSANTPLYIKGANKQLLCALKRYFENVVCE